MKNTYFILLFVIPFFSCSEKKTEFIRSEKRVYGGAGAGYYHDIVFIVNPPEKWIELIQLIDSFNNTTVNKSKVINSYNTFSRDFYRESRKTPRDFEDDESFIPDRLGDHWYDHIARYSMTQCDGARLKGVKLDSTNVQWKLESPYEGPFPFGTIYQGHTCFE